MILSLFATALLLLAAGLAVSFNGRLVARRRIDVYRVEKRRWTE
jgi:hypothetical protein